MKVCVVTQQYGVRWSGLGTYATNLIKGLAERAIPIVVVCPEGMDNPAGVKIIPVKMGGWEKKVNYWLPLALRFGGVLKKVLAEEKLDIIHFTDAKEALFFGRGRNVCIGTMNDYYAASASASPMYFVKNYHDWPIRYPYYLFLKGVEPIALEKLDSVIANSKYVAEVITRKYRVNSGKIQVINYGIDLSEPKRGENLGGKPSILFVGANFERKGLPDLIRAVFLVKRTMPEIKVYVVGEDPKTRVMRELARNLGMEDAVEFRGRLPNEMVRALRADIFVMPSLVEGFGIVFLEAMSAGIPVIGGRVGGTVELIRDGYNGFTVLPGDVEDLARKILRVAQDDNIRRRFIEAGKRTASEYTVSTMVEKTIELYRSLISKHK